MKLNETPNAFRLFERMKKSICEQNKDWNEKFPFSWNFSVNVQPLRKVSTVIYIVSYGKTVMVTVHICK